VDGLALLSQARAVGLTIQPVGERLVIRGPKVADAVARQLLSHKAVVLAALAASNGNTTPANPEVAAFDDLPLPGPACPRCKSLESWTDGLGRQRCGACEANTLHKGLQLAERAAWLRDQTQPEEPAHQDDAGCVPGGMVDMLDPEGKRLALRQLRGFGGT
jgi:hypothetical protein